MMKGISVIICCHNSSGKLRPTLKALSLQKDLQEIALEIILVDNNSIDRTAEFANKIWEKLAQPFPLKIVSENKPGLSNARATGILTSKFDYLIFCDDDNWLAQDYLRLVYNIFETNKEVGMVGGVGVAVLNNKAPQWFIINKGFGYAIGDEGRHTGFTDFVYGAGMAIRKETMLALNTKQISFILSDRVGRNLSSGGDLELCLLVKYAGKKIWFDAGLIFKHDLGDSRLNWNYYRKLRYAFGCSNVYISLYKDDYSIPDKNIALNNLLKYIIRYSHLLILSIFFHKEKYAYAIQKLGALKTLYFENFSLKQKLKTVHSNKIYLTSLINN